MENTSGQGEAAAVPAEIDRWNWGAFLLNWIWGIGNNTFIALLMFVPFANLVMPFVLGAKGSAWAWRNKRWDSVEHFRRVQRLWAVWGVVVLAVSVFGFAAFFYGILSLLKNSEPMQLSLARLEANPEVSRLVGKPVSPGFPSGRIQISGPSGYASLSFSVEGPNGEGTVHVEAVRDLGRWEIRRMVFEQKTAGRRIDLAQ